VIQGILGALIINISPCDDIDCHHVGGSRVVLPKNGRDCFIKMSICSVPY